MEKRIDCQNECQQEDSCKSPMPDFIKLWFIDYKIEPNYQGVAVVSGRDAGEAKMLFLRRSQHNGTVKEKHIQRIEQIPFPCVPEFITETYFKTFK